MLQVSPGYRASMAHPDYRDGHRGQDMHLPCNQTPSASHVPRHWIPSRWQHFCV